MRNFLRISSLPTALALSLLAAALPACSGANSEQGDHAITANTTGDAGSPASTNVSTYSLALPALPGGGGTAPKITLAYAAGRTGLGSGFGEGWHLDVPSIEVATKSGIPYQTSFESGAFVDGAFVPDNAYFLGTKRLFLDAARGPLHYRLDGADEGIQVIYHATAFAPAGANPIDGASPSISSGLEVIYPDGRRELYSGDASVAESEAPLVTRFPLVYAIGAQGDSVRYVYEKVGNRSYLREVVFASGMSRYTFELAESESAVQTYKRGFPQGATRLVTRMVARHGDEAQARWCFEYAGPDGLGRATRKSSSACDGAGEAGAAPLGANAHDQLVAISRCNPPPATGEPAASEPRLQFAYSPWDEGNRAARDIVYAAPPAQAPLIVVRQGRQVSVDPASDRFQKADIDGDGIADLVELEDGQFHVYDGRSGASEPFQWKATVDRGQLGASSFEGGASQLIDVNGDGLADVVATTPAPAGGLQWSVYLNLTGVDAAGTWYVSFARADFALPAPFLNLSSVLRDREAFRLVDLNGDGLPELTWLNAAQGFVCAYANTGGFFQNPVPSTLLFGDPDLNDATCGPGVRADVSFPSDARALGSYFVDANGDGVRDFVTFGQTHMQLNVSYGRGDLRFGAGVIVDLNTEVRPERPGHVADIDGDGQDEIVISQGQASTSGSVVIDFNRANQAQLPRAGTLAAVQSGAAR